jgi:hypothetical protein
MAIDVTRGNPLRHIATINSSTTYLIPSQANRIYLNVFGASGGGGGHQNSQHNSAAAGGAGHVAAG